MRVRFLLILLLLNITFALEAKFQADSLNGSLGDIIAFSWDITHDHEADFSIKAFDLDDTGIEVLSHISHKTDFGTHLQFETAVYDSVGIYHFPSLVVYTEDAAGLDSLYLQGPDLEITSILSPSDTTFRDIKGLHRIRRPFNLVTLLWIAGGLIILYLVYLIVKRIRVKKSEKAAEEIIIPPEEAHVVALRDLEHLKRSKYLRFEQFKEFHSELTHILKQYYENRYLMDALDLTTSELTDKIKGMGEFDDALVSETSDILEIADLIKFAKAPSNELDSAAALNQAIEIVNRTKLQNDQGENA